jgi:hypothetical protein
MEQQPPQPEERQPEHPAPTAGEELPVPALPGEGAAVPIEHEWPATIGEASAADRPSPGDPDAARRDFPWFGQEEQPVARLESEGDSREPASGGWDAAQARLQQAAAEAYGEDDDEPPSLWSAEREVLEQEAIARLVAQGVDPEQAREQVEYATDKERFERAVARGINAEDAVSAVEGARLVQRRLAARQMAEQAAAQQVQPEQAPERLPRPSGDLAADTDGELIPRYDFVLRRADRLAIGDLLREPRLGEVWVSWVADSGWDEVRHTGLVQVFWIGDDGSRAARSYRLDERLTVRVPDLVDAGAIERALDRSRYHRTALGRQDARLIAAHLQRGPGSALYRLAVTGEITERTLDELQEVSQSGRAHLRRWARALGNYCVNREDWGPLPGLEERQW